MTSSESLFAQIGGEDGTRRLVETFYDIVEYEPAGRVLHGLHLRGHGVAHSRIEQFKFLCGFLGGPKLYAEEHGHSNVRKMHEHVEIDEKARDAWLTCMSMAIDREKIDDVTKASLMQHFRAVTLVLQNHP